MKLNFVFPRRQRDVVSPGRWDAKVSFATRVVNVRGAALATIGFAGRV